MELRKKAKPLDITGALTLSQKGLLLLASPIIVQLVLVGQLSALQGQAEADTKQAIHAREVYSTANDAMKAAFEYVKTGLEAVDQGTAAMSDGPSRPNLPPPLMPTQQTLDTMNKLRDLVKDDAKDVAIVDGAIRGVNGIDAAVKHIKDISWSDVPPEARAVAPAKEPRKILFRRVRQNAFLMAALSGLEQDQKQIYDTSPERQAQIRGNAKKVVLVFTALNVMFLLILAWFFSGRIIHRLKLMIDNTIRFTAERALHPPLRGADEIARLDTAFHNMADAVNEAAQTRKEAEQLREQVLQMVSHDLRTPLTTLQGFHSLLETGTLGVLNERGEHFLYSAHRNTERMLQLINDLLDIEKIESGKLQLELAAIDLSEIFEQLVGTLTPLAERDELVLTALPTKLSVEADQHRLLQVLTNLIGNAMKFSPKGGKVTLAAEPAGGEVEISVTDEGRGIPPHLLTKIFDRFEQVEQADAKEKGGSGLGLAICKALVELHQGEIFARSEVGKGSTFVVRIPAAQTIDTSTKTATVSQPATQP